METYIELIKLHEEIRKCSLCKNLPEEAYPLVRGNCNAKIVLVSQAPSRGATLAGYMWKNNRSGDTLKEWLNISEDIFYDENIFYLTAIGKCYPGKGKGGDKTPSALCAETWLTQELHLLRPELVITIGCRAFKWFFPQHNYDQNLNGMLSSWNGLRVLCLPHPSGANNAWKAKNRARLESIIRELRKQIHFITLHLGRIC